MFTLPGGIQVRLLYISIPGPPVIVFLSPTISQAFFQNHHQLPPRKSSFYHLEHLSHLILMVSSYHIGLPVSTDCALSCLLVQCDQHLLKML